MSFDPAEDWIDRDDLRDEQGYAPAPSALPVPPGRGVCRDCDAGRDTLRHANLGERGVALYQRPRATGEGAAHRVICNDCVGKINSAHTERITGAVRDLKSAALVGNNAAEREAFVQLAALAGKEAAEGCAAALRQTATEKPKRGRS